VALVWRTGQQTSIHDHRCWGAVAVVRGTEHECRYSLVPEAGPGPLHLTPSGEASYRAGSICAFAPPGDIHRVANSGPGTAISFHVYGADIARFGSSIRRNYSEALIAA
jgi:predicted metal-dependent enzyme (double-stranded beta helix superfamily)